MTSKCICTENDFVEHFSKLFTKIIKLQDFCGKRDITPCLRHIDTSLSYMMDATGKNTCNHSLYSIFEAGRHFEKAHKASLKKEQLNA